MGKYGTNLEGFGGFEGGVNSEDGAPLVSTSSDGETALLFGPAALREIQAGVANGDFAIPPDESTATITSENPLPYWTFTDVNSAGAITCAVVADASAGSGNVLRWTINTGTLTGKSAQISRYIPIASSRDRALTIVPDAYISEGIGTNAQFKLTYSYVKQDLTTTGTGATGTPRSIAGSIGASPTTAPSDAAYVYLVITLETTGTTAALTGDLAEVKLRSFFSAFFITDNNDSATYAPAAFEQGGGNLIIGANGGTGNTGIAGTFSVSGTTTSTGLLTASAGITATGLIATERASALDEAFTARQTADATARFALYSNGAMEWGAGGARDLNLYRASAGLLKSDFALAATNISLSGSQGVRHDTPATTTQTSSAGIWVLVSGTNYQLRRNSSSARYKTNIVDADEVVLEAARKIKPRHYESTIEDENGATRLGFIAEEIHESGLTHAVGYDAEGKPETIDPTALIAALWHRVSDLEDRLKALEEA